MDLQLNHLAHVRYTKTTNLGSGHIGDVTERVILPTYIPGDAVKALDLSDLPESEALAVQTLAHEYAEYVQAKMSTVFNFEDWITHVTGRSTPPLKYRTFKLHTLDVIKSE